jgi:hypothetical protein
LRHGGPPLSSCSVKIIRSSVRDANSASGVVPIADEDTLDWRPADELWLGPTRREREVLHVEVMIDAHRGRGMDHFPIADAQPDVSPMLDLIPDGAGASIEHKRSDRRFAAILRCTIFICRFLSRTAAEDFNVVALFVSVFNEGQAAACIFCCS